MELPGILLIVAGLLVVVSLVQPLAAKLRLPHSVVLAAVGVVIGVLSHFLLYTDLTDAFNDVAQPFVDLPFNSTSFLFVFLPILLFQAALTIDVRRMVEDAAPILLLAVVAVFVATAAIGLSLAPLVKVPFAACLLVGSIVATTDPAAVVGIFRDLGAPQRLTRLVEGESLLNDAAAISLFTLLLAALKANAELEILAVLWTFGYTFAGGILIGLVGGQVVAWALPLVRTFRSAEITLTLALPYIVFVVGERFLHVSGIVAAVVAGLTIGALGRRKITPENWEHLVNVWEQVAFWAGSLVFILASILVPKLLGRLGLEDFLLLLVLVAAALAARAVVLFGLLPLLTMLKLNERVRNSFKLIITWGGVRGAVTLALALAVTESDILPPEIKRFVVVLATGFVLFTLFVNGTTLRPLIHLLRLTRLSPVQQALRRQILTLSLAEVRDSVREAGLDYGLSSSVVQSAVAHYDARIAQVAAPGSADEISDHERFAVGLVVLADRERELVRLHHGYGTFSARIVEWLLRDNRRIAEAARSGGRTGYNRAARMSLAYTIPFRIALVLHRWFHLEGLLSRSLADRFEALLMKKMILEELRPFIDRHLGSMLGDRVAELLREVLAGRMASLLQALDALRLQYPTYSEALERRFLLRSGLRRERLQYNVLAQEGLIGEDLHHHLHAEVLAMRQVIGKRPALDLGLERDQMVRRFELFSGLSDAQLTELALLLKPRFMVPGERIIRRGEEARNMYFISSGAVEVVLPDQRVRLGRGDFFGEIALLDNRPRIADVVSIAYCWLLVLEKSDFLKFLEYSPEIRQHIDRTAGERLTMNSLRIGDHPAS